MKVWKFVKKIIEYTPNQNQNENNQEEQNSGDDKVSKDQESPGSKTEQPGEDGGAESEGTDSSESQEPKDTSSQEAQDIKHVQTSEGHKANNQSSLRDATMPDSETDKNTQKSDYNQFDGEQNESDYDAPKNNQDNPKQEEYPNSNFKSNELSNSEENPQLESKFNGEIDDEKEIEDDYDDDLSDDFEEPKKELSEEANEFLNQLNDLPSFENKDRNNGYSIDTKSCSEIPESIVKTLITKFLNQRFCKMSTNLNVRSSSLEKTDGFYKWEVKDVIVHYKTHQVRKVLKDKYSYEYADGKCENIPLSFYFDLSGSMSSYTNMLATIAIELLKKNVKVLIGFNQVVNVQIDSVDKKITVERLADILNSAAYSGWGYNNKSHFIKDPLVKYKFVDENIDKYLMDKKAQKCVVFSDFDPLREVVNLSNHVDTYWFCFAKDFERSELKRYSGFLYPVQNADDILNGLIKVNENRFETLMYVDNPKELQKRR